MSKRTDALMDRFESACPVSADFAQPIAFEKIAASKKGVVTTSPKADSNGVDLRKRTERRGGAKIEHCKVSALNADRVPLNIKLSKLALGEDTRFPSYGFAKSGLTAALAVDPQTGTAVILRAMTVPFEQPGPDGSTWRGGSLESWTYSGRGAAAIARADFQRILGK